MLMKSAALAALAAFAVGVTVIPDIASRLTKDEHSAERWMVRYAHTHAEKSEEKSGGDGTRVVRSDLHIPPENTDQCKDILIRVSKKPLGTTEEIFFKARCSIAYTDEITGIAVSVHQTVCVTWNTRHGYRPACALVSIAQPGNSVLQVHFKEIEQTVRQAMVDIRNSVSSHRPVH